MNTNDLFPSSYLKAADLQGRGVILNIHRVEYEEIGGDMKGVIYFQDRKKGLVLNKTNAQMIASRYGDEMDNWGGANIELRPEKTHFQGQLVDCIRVYLPVPPAQPDSGSTEAPIEAAAGEGF